ncbi:phosphoglycerate mutase-like protein [Earliella scabrosa]|nr:phosphoglycerate mutase-like protein [Earliella scabrosa]
MTLPMATENGNDTRTPRIDSDTSATTAAPAAPTTPTTPAATVVARVYIVRHGETDHNREGIMQGQLDTALNAAGVEQARLAADALEDVPFGVAYSSDLERARKTAEIIVEKHPGLVLDTREDLRERYMGDWQGESIALRKFPPANMEPQQDFVARGARWWNEDVLRHAQRKASELDSKLAAAAAAAPAQPEVDFEPVHILAVSHGGLIGQLVLNLIGSRKLRVAEGVEITRCFNASISVIEVYGDRKGLLVSYADTTHLNVDLVQENADVL